MLLEEEQILGSIKLQIVNFLLQVVRKSALKLLFLQSKYEADQYAVKNSSFDLRKIPQNLKKLWIHDQKIVDRRWSECQGCEHLIKATNQCKKCGCFMKVKTRISTARCPIGKWEKEFNFLEGKPNVSTVTQ